MTEVIKEFLVSLGFEVDSSSFAAFGKAIESASVRVLALYAAVKLATAAIAYGITEASESFEKMGYEYRIIAPAINRVLYMRQELLKAYALAGVNIRSAITNAVQLNISLAKTKFAIDGLYKSVAAKFFPLLTKQLDVFRKNLYANMPKIQAALEKFVNFIFKAFEATTILGMRVWSILSRVYDFFKQLHEATNGWSTIILGVIAAWRLLNLSFLATPLGMLLALGLAVLALYDDFKGFQEGKVSFFNWAPVLPIIKAVSETISELSDSFGDLVEFVSSLVIIFNDLGATIGSGKFDAVAISIDNMTEAFENLVSSDGFETFAKFIGVLQNPLGAIGNAAFGDAIKSLGANLGSNINGALQFGQAGGMVGAGPILGGPTSNSNTNQNVNMQTQIHVQGGADANAIGKSVVNEMGRVNFDMYTNSVGKTQ